MTDTTTLQSRRCALLALAGAPALFSSLPTVFGAAERRNRELNFLVRDEFKTDVANVAALLKSVANEIWRHCSQTKFLAAGFAVYHNQQTPITHFKLEDSRIRIGLSANEMYWAQYSFQFGHEFCHALIDHTHDEQRQWHVTQHANHWLDETLCETASLFVLRAMSKSWQTQPPYPNWKSFSGRLADYAKKRMEEPKHQLPAETTFPMWFRKELPSLRKDPVQREKNTIIACQLLPLFEATPAGWESVTALKLGKRDTERSLPDHLREWQANVREDLRPFVMKLSQVLLA